MIKCSSLKEARAQPGVVHIESGQEFAIAYFNGDALPAHCKTDQSGVADDLSAQDAMDESQDETAVEIAAVKDPSLWTRIVDWISK